jgi:DNA-binding CsgD family transcriptional regulator
MNRSAAPYGRTAANVRAVCDAGLDATTLRYRLSEVLAELFETDASSFVEIDPCTSMPKNSVLRGYTSAFCRQIVREAVTVSPVLDFAARAVRGDGTMRLSDLPLDRRCDPYARTVRSFGFSDDLHSLLTVGRRPIGFLALARRARPRFSDLEVDLVDALRPLLAAGLRAALLRDERQAELATEPAMLVLDACGQVEVANPAAAALLRVPPSPEISGGVGEVWAVLQTAHVVAQGRGRVPAFAIVLGGRRRTLRADRSIGADGASRTMILLEPLQRAGFREFLWLGLSPREAEIAAAVVRGDGTAEIAAASGLSPNTIKTHVRSIFEKLDVGSRRELARRFIRG